MEAAMRNVHHRQIDAPPEVLGALLDRLATDADPLWPSPQWPPLRLDNGLTPGSAGGHGPIRYHVTEYEPGHRVRFAFDGHLDGWHELTVDNGLTHAMGGRLIGPTTVTWPLAIRWLHDALVEDLLDNAELAATGRLSRPNRYGPWVRLLRHRLMPAPAKTEPPAEAALLTAERQHRNPPDLADAWTVRIGPGLPTDPGVWARAIFQDPPKAVVALLLLRNLLVRLVGIAPGTRDSFAAKDQNQTEHLLGTDEKHLDFRASILVHNGAVTVSTVAWVHNRLGRLYLVPVKIAHPRVVRAMLARARRRLAGSAPPAGGRHGGERAQATPATEGAYQ
jgi:hypothetical protein